MRILIVDDEIRIRSSLEGLLKDEGYKVRSCESGEKALVELETFHADVILLDVFLAGMDGLETLHQIQKYDTHPVVLMMSGQADISTAVQATRLGAHNFFEKPLNADRILLELKNISDKLILESRINSLEALVAHQEEMIGNSAVILELKEAIAKAAPSEGRVLIYGENGTGKELVARAIHRLSPRSQRSFIGINCAALPKDLVESELFGYEKGAFTGALQQKPGRFELAEGGTLFLDEIGDMPLDTQAKLLRVLEENEAVRVGGNKPYPFNVRVIAATNKHLLEEIKYKRFREDLYYRLNVVPLEVPPLRNRKDDIPVLAEYFLQYFCHQTGKGRLSWDEQALSLLKTYDWPGNVRELKNFIERTVILNQGDKILVSTLKNTHLLSSVEKVENAISKKDKGKSLKDMLSQYEKQILEQGLIKNKGNVSQLARCLGIDRANLHRKLKAYGIK